MEHLSSILSQGISDLRDALDCITEELVEIRKEHTQQTRLLGTITQALCFLAADHSKEKAHDQYAAEKNS